LSGPHHGGQQEPEGRGAPPHDGTTAATTDLRRYGQCPPPAAVS
jgi:hypothetical protein